VVKVNAPAWRLRGQGGGISDRGLEVVHAVGIRYLLFIYISISTNMKKKIMFLSRLSS
jgi:hypothetical protein